MQLFLLCYSYIKSLRATEKLSSHLQPSFECFLFYQNIEQLLILLNVKIKYGVEVEIQSAEIIFWNFLEVFDFFIFLYKT